MNVFRPLEPRRHRMLGALAAGAVTGLCALSLPLAYAHDSVVSGSPGIGETVSEFPDEITLEFSGIPREGFNNFAVSNSATNEVLFSGEPHIDGNRLTLALPEDLHPADGTYRVGFQITSSDGHATRGQTEFIVHTGDATQAPVADGTAATPTTSAETDRGSSEEIAAEDSSSTVPWVVGVAAVVAIVAAAFVAVRRHKLSQQLHDTTTEES